MKRCFHGNFYDHLALRQRLLMKLTERDAESFLLTTSVHHFEIHPRVRLAGFSKGLLVGGEIALPTAVAVLHNGLSGVAG